MKSVEITLEAYEDLEGLKEYLDERRDFLYMLFGVKMNSDESEKYWEE